MTLLTKGIPISARKAKITVPTTMKTNRKLINSIKEELFFKEESFFLECFFFINYYFRIFLSTCISFLVEGEVDQPRLPFTRYAFKRRIIEISPQIHQTYESIIYDRIIVVNFILIL